MEIATGHFEFVHGAKPRGRGRWGFYFDGQTQIEALFSVREQLLFSAACKVARAEARRRGARRIEVAS